jgi:molybdopterin/thiamine biosynthesis adenylyltransferase
MLNKEEIKRYDRQIRFISKTNQKRLKQKSVTVVGLGGIGSAICIYLAGAGIGLRIIDSDRVQLENLHRQVLYETGDVGKFKADVAKKKILSMNPEINVESQVAEIDDDNAVDLLRGSNVVLDALDNFKSRFIMNEACVKLKMPFTYAAAIENKVSFTFMIPGETPCLRCIFPKHPKDTKASEVGVMGTAPGFVGVLSASQCLNFLLKKPVIKNKLFYCDMDDFQIDMIDIKRNERCGVCG